MPFSPGARLGPYEIVSPAGAGGMGDVYRALYTRLDRTVALKVVPPDLTSDPAARQRLDLGLQYWDSPWRAQGQPGTVAVPFERQPWGLMVGVGLSRRPTERNATHRPGRVSEWTNDDVVR